MNDHLRLARAGAVLLALVVPAASRADTRWTRLEDALSAGDLRSAVAIADSVYGAESGRRRKHPREMAAWLDTLGFKFFMAGTAEALEQAATAFERGLALRERADGRTHASVASTLSALASIRDYQGRWAEALPLERRALEIRTMRSGPNSEEVGDSRRQIGKFFYFLGRMGEAIPELEASVAVYRSAADVPANKRAGALNDLGEALRAGDRYERAESTFREGISTARAELQDEDPLQPVLVNNLAGLFRDLARYDEAEPLLVDALERRRRHPSPDPSALATGYLNLAEVFRLQGRVEEAAPLYDQALDRARQDLGADNPLLVPYLSQSAVQARELRRYTRAESLFREAVTLIQRTLPAGHPMLAQSLHDLGELLEAEGQHDSALVPLRQALAIRDTALGANHPQTATSRVAVARSLISTTGSRTEAAALLDRAITALEPGRTSPETHMEAHALRAQLRHLRGERSAALEDMTAALGWVDSLRAHRGGGEIVRLDFLVRQQELYDRMIAWQLEGQNIEGAFQTHERSRARALMDRAAASGLNLRADIPAEVLAALDRGDRLACGKLSRIQREIDALRWRENSRSEEVAAQLALLATQRDSAALEVRRAGDALREASPVWRRVVATNGQIALLSDVRALLKRNDAALLSYRFGEEGAWLFAITASDSPVRAWSLAIRPADAAALSVQAGALTAGALSAIVDGEPSAARPVREGLADQLAKPATGRDATKATAAMLTQLESLRRVLVPDSLWSLVRGRAIVLLIPDASLHRLPFEALVVRAASELSATRYWLDDGPAISYGASGSALLHLDGRAITRSGVDGPWALSVSNPMFDAREIRAARGADPSSRFAGTRSENHAFEKSSPSDAAIEPTRGSWRPLPGTIEETHEMTSALGESHVQVLMGLEATEARARAAFPGKRIIHLATHGFVTDRLGDVLAGVVLTPDTLAVPVSENDGLLQLYEVYQLQLDCELAVLSACETNRGPQASGEGVFALSRGFLTAGARRVVATLWEVPDEPTSYLIGRFFTRIAAARPGSLRYSATLRDARREMRHVDVWAHPAYWAAFVLAGLP